MTGKTLFLENKMMNQKLFRRTKMTGPTFLMRKRETEGVKTFYEKNMHNT